MDRLLSRIDHSPAWAQIIPLSLTVLVLGALVFLLRISLGALNLLPIQPLSLSLRWFDVLVGATIYLKTSIDFALLMGRLMAAHPGWRRRVAIEIGTALGNAVGTIAIIAIWVVFKDVQLLLALMIFLAALVLFELAHEGLEHFTSWESQKGIKRSLFVSLRALLGGIKKLTHPLLSRIMPDLGENLSGKSSLSWIGLLTFSMSVPFILGLDDFAGYVPLFSIVNIYGFAVGVLSAHTILNIALFLSPTRTIRAVKNAWISLLGTLVFIGLAVYGLVETGKIIAGLWR